jgi:serine/threonine-protein kinase
MGVVVAAHHIDLDERVAIKFLLPEALGHQDSVVRFMREARAAVKIKSEHVARVFDVGRLENGAPYIVMEHLDGSDLSAWLTRQGPLGVEQAVEFVLQACEAIAEAHSLGIVHRDLKPANLFVIRRRDGVLSVKVLDFGISKTTGLVGSGPVAAMTKTSALMGSPLYMSPEQMQSSRDVDSRSDIWSLGVILYELISGGPPFVADTMPELVLRVVQTEPTSLRARRLEVPEGLEAVIGKCLEKQRDKRYESIGEFAVAVLPFGPKSAKGSVARISGVLRAAGLSGTALALPPSSDSENLATTAATASWGKTTSPKSRMSWLFVGGLALAVALGALAWRALTGPSPAAEREATSTAAVADTMAHPSTAPATSAAPAGVVEPPASVTVAPSVLPSTAPPAAGATASGQPVLRAAPRKAKVTRPAPTKPNCDPPFTIDSNGHKVPKAGCL